MIGDETEEWQVGLSEKKRAAAALVQRLVELSDTHGCSQRLGIPKSFLIDRSDPLGFL